MHPDAAALERAILVAPDDRTPRLVYADWVDEFDDDPAFSEALRSEEFDGIPAAAAAAELPLRQAWVAARGVRGLTGTVGAIGLALVTFAPLLRLIATSARAAALGVALSGQPGRPAAPVVQPVVRRMT
jgi:uncharacterized protein (TIGR02996 family)